MRVSSAFSRLLRLWGCASGRTSQLRQRNSRSSDSMKHLRGTGIQMAPVHAPILDLKATCSAIEYTRERLPRRTVVKAS
jgi:hypothetical protein